MKKYEPFIMEEDRLMLRTVRDFVEKEIMPVRKQLDDPQRGHHIYTELMEGLVHIGLQKRALPREIGGLGQSSAVSQTTTSEELARGDPLFGIMPGMAAWIFGPAIVSRNMTVLEKFAAQFCEDKLHTAALSLTEPSGGCNIASAEERGRTIQTIARSEGDEWVINGHKRWTSNGGIAEIYLVLCQTDHVLGEDGIALIYVPAGTPGMSFGKPENLMGFKADINLEVFYDDVRVPKAWRASDEPGRDGRNVRRISCFARLISAASLTGVAQGVFDYVVEYTANRFFGGKQVRQHTMQAGILADMAIDLLSARAFYLQIASWFDNRAVFGSPTGDFLLGMASAIRIYAADATIRSCNKAMELMGAYGYSEDYPIAKYLRDSKILQLWEGGVHQTRIDVARAFYSVHGPELVIP